MPSNSSLFQTTPSHELAISTRPPPTFYFQRQLCVLALGPRLLQSHLHLCAPQKASQNPGITALVLTTTSPLKSQMHLIVHLST
jgi:hypothetical protein